MPHWKKMMDPKELLAAHDLDGRDVTVTIVDVVGGELNNGTKKNKKPIASIASGSGRKLDKKLALNPTNCKTIEQLSGSADTDDWKGLRVTLFPTTTPFGNEIKECIRIRPYPPKANGKAAADADARGNGDALTDRIAEEMAKNADSAPAQRDRDDIPGDEATDA